MARGINKAHTATLNRIARRYGATVNRDSAPDLQTANLTVEVETTATLREAIRRLNGSAGPAFVAVTNREGLADALRLADGTSVGVMDPQGEIVRQSQPSFEPADDAALAPERRVE